MRVNGSIIIVITFVLSCATTNYKEIALTNPEKLIKMHDSLNNITDPKFNEALIMVFNSRGLQAMEKQNYNEALKYFHKSQKVSQSDSVSKYSLLMVSAFQKLSSGKKEVLWDAIQSFYKASNIYPLNGEPHYYIGETYLKLGDKDFDLIIDSYDKALSLNLTESLKEKVEIAKKEALRRRDLLKSFWK
tara:strand:+ start:1577 stop:2143 length:567 start_codon:yes stop_codon:yes gene_type:complete